MSNPRAVQNLDQAVLFLRSAHEGAESAEGAVYSVEEFLEGMLMMLAAHGVTDPEVQGTYDRVLIARRSQRKAMALIAELLRDVGSLRGNGR